MARTTPPAAPCVVFLRAVNVAGHKRFRPADLARDLAAFDAVNIGAAGTFVIRRPPADLRAEIARRLPFESDPILCPARDLLDLAARHPFANAPADPDARLFLTILSRPPATPPALPLRRPDHDDWQVLLFEHSDPFVVTARRPRGRADLYPNEVVEKLLGTPATTRAWTTVETICRLLQGGP